MTPDETQRELVLRFLDRRVSAEEQAAVEALLRSNEEARRFLRDVAEHAVMVADIERLSGASNSLKSRHAEKARSLTAERKSSKRWRPLALTAVGALLAITIIYQRVVREQSSRTAIDRPRNSESRSPIARISGLSGPFTWRGDGGEVQTELNAGVELPGGTIEGLTPDSWIELTFRDDSKVTIAGMSMMTFSHNGHKKLHLNHGTLSATVVAQLPEYPMLVTTKTAELNIVGTRFEVEAELDSTLLQVREGIVRVRRLSDGQTVDVPAWHRILALVDGDMRTEPSPPAVNDWKSQLHLGPEYTYGKWQPASEGRPTVLQAIPFLAPQDKYIVLHLAGLPVRRSNMAPVTVMPESHFVLRGRLRTTAAVYFGIRVVCANGEFAGMFLTQKPVQATEVSPDFEVQYDLKDFGLDPCVWDRKDELPTKPDGLIMAGVWCFTHTGSSTGLEVKEVEMVPPSKGMSAK